MYKKLLNVMGSASIGTAALLLLAVLVLVPRVGVVKNKSIESGIRVNMLIVEGIVQSIIDDYSAEDGSIAVENLESKIASDIERLSSDGQRITNPITGNTAVTSAVDGIITSAIAYETNDNADNGVDINAIWAGTLAGSAGTVVYCAYVNTEVVPSKLCVKIIPYGTNNERLTALEKTVSQ